MQDTRISDNFPMLRQMSCPEIVSLYNAIRTDTNVKMEDYIHKLQSRYGDPRAYHAQQQEMRREEAAMLHDQGRRKETLLEDAYQAQVKKNRQEHQNRLNALDLAKSRHPESQGVQRRSRTRRLAQTESSQQPQDSSAPQAAS